MLKYLMAISLLLLLGTSDRPVPPTIGFFMDNWQPRTFTTPAFDLVPAAPAARPASTLSIDADSVITRIPPSEFGHNVDFWIGTMSTQPTFLTNVTNLNPHILRWPGGSASDAYF